jgi:hypothetical protein
MFCREAEQRRAEKKCDEGELRKSGDIDRRRPVSTLCRG